MKELLVGVQLTHENTHHRQPSKKGTTTPKDSLKKFNPINKSVIMQQSKTNNVTHGSDNCQNIGFPELQSAFDATGKYALCHLDKSLSHLISKSLINISYSKNIDSPHSMPKINIDINAQNLKQGSEPILDEKVELQSHIKALLSEHLKDVTHRVSSHSTGDNKNSAIRLTVEFKT